MTFTECDPRAVLGLLRVLLYSKFRSGLRFVKASLRKRYVGDSLLFVLVYILLDRLTLFNFPCPLHLSLFIC